MTNTITSLKEFWKFLQDDTWQSWLVSLILMIFIIKIILFPTIAFVTGSSLPLVVVESCSMYHEAGFDDWWFRNSAWYDAHNITKEQFKEFSFKNGLNKGDIILVSNRKQPKQGDIIIFNANQEALAKYPIIHRVVSENQIATKGDHNPTQFTKNNNIQMIDETNIQQEQIIGKATAKIPLLGWIKLIFFEPSKPESQRGLCK